MRFSIPQSLIKLEYFGSDGGEEVKQTEYDKARDFAFFVVQFNYTKNDYNCLTELEKRLIVKAWEDKKVMDTTLTYRAIHTANYNLNRGKKRFRKLWQKDKVLKADRNYIQYNLSLVKQNLLAEGNEWVKQIYKANGKELKERV